MHLSTRWFTSESPRPRQVATWAGAPWLAVVTVCLGAFLGQFDASVVTLALPAIQEEFGKSPEWVSLGYLLALVALVAPVGRLSDVAGRKLVYLYGFTVFTAASAACAFAWDLPSLVAFRVVQAVGAAMLQANSVALVIASVPKVKLHRALGVQAAAQAVGLALGPTVGGLFVGTVGWRWVFAVNVPIGLLALVAGHYLLPRTHDRGAGAPVRPLNVLLLATATTGALLLLSGVDALYLLAVVVPAAVWYVAREPLLRKVGLGLFGAFCGYLALFGPLVVVPFTTDRGPVETGLLLTALPAGFALTATARWRGSGLLGILVSTVDCAVLALGVVDAVTLGVLGLGLGLFVPANNARLLAAVPRSDAGAGGGLVNLARGLGTAFGVALPLLLTHRHGPGAAFWALAVVALLAALGQMGTRTSVPYSRKGTAA
ncbi:MFS transporter [Actinosynnema sp. NPDC020468]|uniref:MFS transporter n=1 Tax=Actinosynnema sp. NPDC020468 TaxID=3154488 RepID=UPI0033FCCBDC